jgi:hypothetical protein
MRARGNSVTPAGHALQVAGWSQSLGKVVDRQHGVRLAATKGRLQLNHWIAAFTN